MHETGLRDRFRGCMLAGAAGDALGYTVEFWSLSAIRSTFGLAGITAYTVSDAHARAVVSDDTQMTLFTAAGLGASCIAAQWTDQPEGAAVITVLADDLCARMPSDSAVYAKYAG